jgi:hypothetical protein
LKRHVPRFITGKPGTFSTVNGTLAVSGATYQSGDRSTPPNIRRTDVEFRGDYTFWSLPGCLSVWERWQIDNVACSSTLRSTPLYLVLWRQVPESILKDVRIWWMRTFRFAVENRLIICPGRRQQPFLDLLNAHVEGVCRGANLTRPPTCSLTMSSATSPATYQQPSRVGRGSGRLSYPALQRAGKLKNGQEILRALWYSAGSQLPDPNPVAPGKSPSAALEIQNPARGSESSGFSLTAWKPQDETTQDLASYFGSVLSPAR